MTVEERLAEALRGLDKFEPSPDLFARVERSLAEDRQFRRRRRRVSSMCLLGLAALIVWVSVSSTRGLAGHLFIDGWRLALAFIALAGAIIIALAPHIRRFARSFVDDVFHLSPATGARFLVVLDIAYYTGFTGLVLVDADAWSLGERLLLFPALEDFAVRLGFLLFAMGALHAVNIAFLPVVGLIYNSIVRADLRRRAGVSAPPESMRARTVDRHARSFAVGIVVLALALALTFLVGGPGGLIIGSLG